MKLLREAAIIIGIYFLGELLSKTVITFIPGNIIGMLILLCLLSLKVIKLEAIENVAKFFLDNLAFFFIPAGVGLLTAVDILKGNALKIVLVCLISTFIVMGATGVTVQWLINKKNKKIKEENSNERNII